MKQGITSGCNTKRANSKDVRARLSRAWRKGQRGENPGRGVMPTAQLLQDLLRAALEADEVTVLDISGE